MAEQRLFSLVFFFADTSLHMSEFACQPGACAGNRAGQSIHLVLSIFLEGVLLGIMLAEQCVLPRFNSLKILRCHRVLVHKGTIYSSVGERNHNNTPVLSQKCYCSHSKVFFLISLTVSVEKLDTNEVLSNILWGVK
jgi:hypothetical protein